MKKRIVFVSSVVLSILLFQIVHAAVGVIPSSYKVGFTPNLKNNFSFNFFSDDDSTFNVTTEGDLAQYVTFKGKEYPGGNTVSVELQLPTKIDVPGMHTIMISGKQIPKGVGGMGITANIRGVLFVDVPFPGKYADITFSVPDANVGDDVAITLQMQSKGTEVLDAQMHVEIYDNDSQLMEKIDFGEKTFVPGESAAITRTLSTVKYTSGDYKAIAFIEYGGKIIKKEAPFRLGRMFVDITNVTTLLYKNRINPVTITIKSYWNAEIRDVYGELYLPDYNIRVKTPTANIGKFETTTLQGFIDTSAVENKSMLAYISVFYGDNMTKKKATLHYIEEKNYTLYYLLAAGIVGIGIILVLFYKIVRLKKLLKEKVLKHYDKKR